MDDKYLSYSWITREYEGCLGIYPTRCMNSYLLDSVLIQLEWDGYTIYKVFNDYYRAIKQR